MITAGYRRAKSNTSSSRQREDSNNAGQQGLTDVPWGLQCAYKHLNQHKPFTENDRKNN
jgi:hypothetical protein